MAARDCVYSARGELVDVLWWENRPVPGGKPGQMVAVPLAKAKALPGAGDRAAYKLELAAWHVRALLSP